jgi:hypothetical protein
MPVENETLDALVNRLVEQGATKTRIAGAIGVSPQYLNDILGGRRALTELIARRIGEQFHLDYRLLLGQAAQDPQPASNSASLSIPIDMVPILSCPIAGEPSHHQCWDATYFRIPEIALPKLLVADCPYVLRFLDDDVEKRLHRNDLVLISQSQNEDAQIVVINNGSECFLARRKSRKWVRIADGQSLTGETGLVGYCVGVLWSTLE